MQNFAITPYIRAEIDSRINVCFGDAGITSNRDPRFFRPLRYVDASYVVRSYKRRRRSGSA